jgi:release factor glutamine methyltransferase
MNDVATALARATQSLHASSETPRLDAELLMAHALRIERGEMLLKMRDLAAPPEFDTLIARRAAHEPVAYIIGHQDFWDLTLEVTPDVLIPRGDSETLIEAAQKHFAGTAAPSRILDLGTGSGALLLAGLSLFPGAQGVGIDASATALAVAGRNASQLGFAVRSQLLHASWRDENWARDLGTFDLILCNPPYIESDASLMPSVQDYEPHSALFAGSDGLADYTLLIPQIPALLTHAGIAIFEIGIGQAGAVGTLADANGLSCVAHSDLAGIARALVMAPKAA